MAAVVKSTRAGYDALSAQTCVKISELFAGAKFAKLDPVYIDSDGKVQPAADDSTQVLFDGFAARGIDSDQIGAPVTILGHGLIMEWLQDSDGYSPADLFYVGAANQLETTGRVPVVMAINDREVIVIAGPGIRRGIDSVALPK
jgi:hypothetical protein